MPETEVAVVEDVEPKDRRTREWKEWAARQAKGEDAEVVETAAAPEPPKVENMTWDEFRAKVFTNLASQNIDKLTGWSGKPEGLAVLAAKAYRLYLYAGTMDWRTVGKGDGDAF
jgi:hypothetical protein